MHPLLIDSIIWVSARATLLSLSRSLDVSSWNQVGSHYVGLMLPRGRIPVNLSFCIPKFTCFCFCGAFVFCVPYAEFPRWLRKARANRKVVISVKEVSWSLTSWFTGSRFCMSASICGFFFLSGWFTGKNCINIVIYYHFVVMSGTRKCSQFVTDCHMEYRENKYILRMHQKKPHFLFVYNWFLKC